MLGLPAEDILRISAKTGEGVPELLDAIIARIPPPEGDPEAPLRALIFDSSYDQYRGVVSSIRIVDGTLHSGARLRFMQANAVHDIEEVGVRTPTALPVEQLGPRRGRLPHRRDQGRRRGPLRRDRHDGPARGHRGAGRLPGPQAHGVLRPLPGGRGRAARPARRPREAQAQRRQLHLRARVLPRPGHRLPLRLPRPAAHGDRARAPGARVRPLADRHGAERGLPGLPHRRQRARRRQPDRAARRQPHRPHRRADAHGDHHHAERVHRHGDGAVPEPPGRDDPDGVPLARAGRARLLASRWPRW